MFVHACVVCGGLLLEMFQNEGPRGPVRVLSNALDAEQHFADLSSVSYY